MLKSRKQMVRNLEMLLKDLLDSCQMLLPRLTKSQIWNNPRFALICSPSLTANDWIKKALIRECLDHPPYTTAGGCCNRRWVSAEFLSDGIQAQKVKLRSCWSLNWDINNLQVLSKMAGDASRWLTAHNIEVDLEADLLALRIPALLPEARRNVLHHSVTFLSQALSEWQLLD